MPFTDWCGQRETADDGRARTALDRVSRADLRPHPSRATARSRLKANIIREVEVEAGWRRRAGGGRDEQQRAAQPGAQGGVDAGDAAGWDTRVVGLAAVDLQGSRR